MSGGLNPIKRRVGFRWDGVVTLGNVLTLLTMFGTVLMLGISIIVWGIRLEGRIDKNVERQALFEAEMRREQERDARNLTDLKTAIEAQGRETRASLDHIFDLFVGRTQQ